MSQVIAQTVKRFRIGEPLPRCHPGRHSIRYTCGKANQVSAFDKAKIAVDLLLSLAYELPI